MGYPRNIVWTATSLLDFDDAVFNDAIRQGRILGTNGPILQVSTTDSAGAVRRPGLEPFAPAADAVLNIDLDAAPWVLTDDVRIIVNGQVERTILEKMGPPGDPLGTTLTPRIKGLQIPISELLPASGDAWLVVEAGQALAASGDLDCDGLPDTGDNNGDGTIDGKDMIDEDVVPERDDDGCFEDTGPLADPPAPERGTAEHFYRMATPQGFPESFTNPFVLDRDGGGFQGVN
jgi:hypothetical protein